MKTRKNDVGRGDAKTQSLKDLGLIDDNLIKHKFQRPTTVFVMTKRNSAVRYSEQDKPRFVCVSYCIVCDNFYFPDE